MKLGIALGGGGGRGAAHIGVLMELAQRGLRPAIISGSSIGGLIGALAAAGLSGEAMLAVFRELRFSRVFSLPRRTPSFTGNRRLERLLEAAIGRPRFDQLGAHLALVTVDMVTRQQVVLDSGDVVAAVLATCAMPLVFPPLRRDGQILVDGAVLNYTPFDVVQDLGADFVIGVDLNNVDAYGAAPTRYRGWHPLDWLWAQFYQAPAQQLLLAALDIITSQSVEKRLAARPPELLLRPYLKDIGIFDYHRWAEGLAAGRAALEAVADRLPQSSEI